MGKKLSFEEWMKRVDAQLIKWCGLSSSDLPDYMYWDMWDDDTSYADAACEALSDAASEMGFDADEIIADYTGEKL